MEIKIRDDIIMGMSQTIILATNKYQNKASTLAEPYGWLVLALGSESENKWLYKAMWNSSGECLTTSSYSDVENELLKTGAFVFKDNLSPGTYSAVLPYPFYTSEAAALSYTAGILRAYGNYVIVMSSNTYSDDNASVPNNEKGSTIVKSIEKDLGINLEVNSDSELNSILQKNGAGPLSELLRMAYGAEKKKT